MIKDGIIVIELMDNYSDINVNFEDNEQTICVNLTEENYDDTEIKQDIEDLKENKADIEDVPTRIEQLIEDSTHRTVTDTEKTMWNNKYDKPLSGIPKTDLDSNVQESLGKADTALQEHQDLSDYATKDSKFIVKDYPSYNDFPAIKIAYRYPTSFNYAWGPTEEYYTYENGKWVTDFTGIYLSISEPPYAYSYEDLQNVTCEITSQLPTDVYPDITVNSFELSYAYGDVTPNYISASYYPVLNTSYGDSQHNPYTNNISFSFDIILPEKINPSISLNALYKALDTGKLYIINPISLEWEEYTGSSLDGTPLINIINNTKQDKLVSGENIKTINNISILGLGNIATLTSSNIKTSRSTSSGNYVYNVTYINSIFQTSRSTTSYKAYDCTYINNLIKTSKTTTNANYYTYSCNYMNTTFLTLDTLPRWDGGNQ